jgi:hypothetical protein
VGKGVLFLDAQVVLVVEAIQLFEFVGRESLRDRPYLLLEFQKFLSGRGRTS